MSQPLLSENFNALPLPDFFPERLRRACAGKRITYRLPAGVRERMHVPENLDTAQWAEKYRQVTAIDAHPGRWRNELVPHTVKAMQLTSAPWLRELYLCWPERAAKTQVITNAAMRKVDRGIESGNIFWLMPNEAEARKALGERIIPALRATPRTARLLSKHADDTTRTMIRFRHGPRLFAAHAGSAASVSSFFGALNIADEIDKADTTGVGKETDIITLFRKRGRDRDDSKNLFVSTPAQAFIYKLTMGAQQVLEYRAKCPHCEHLVSPGEQHVIIPKDADVEQVSNGEIPISLACPDCGVEWSDQDRKDAYQCGDWVIIKGADISRPETVGMHMTAYVLPAVPLKEIATAILRAGVGGETEKKALANGYDCKDYVKENVQKIKDDHILRFKSELPRNLVPPNTARLALIVDTQQASFYYKVVAYSYAPEVKPHQVRHGIVETFEDLEGILYGTGEHCDFKDHTGKQFRIVSGVIDSGGTRRGYQKHSRTYEVYEWCSRHRIMTPLKGVHGRAGEMLSYKDIVTFPGTNKPIPGGLKRVNVRVDVFKDDLERRLGCEPDDAQAMSYASDIDEHFAKHYTGETKDEHGDWQHTKKGQRIDYWDCDVYVLAHREMIKLRIPRKPEISGEDQQQRSRQQATTQSATRPLPGWFRNRG